MLIKLIKSSSIVFIYTVFIGVIICSRRYNVYINFNSFIKSPSSSNVQNANYIRADQHNMYKKLHQRHCMCLMLHNAHTKDIVCARFCEKATLIFKSYMYTILLFLFRFQNNIYHANIIHAISKDKITF